MSEVALHTHQIGAPPAARAHGTSVPDPSPVPDAVLRAVLSADCAAGSWPLSELTLARQAADDGPNSRVEIVTLLRGDTVVARAVVKTRVAHTDLGKLRAIAPHGLPAPRLIAVLPEHSAVIMEEARGARLDRLMQHDGAGTGSPPPRAFGAVVRAGIALAAFHRIAPAEIGRLTLERLLGGLHPAPALLPGALGRTARRVANRLLALPDPIAERAVLCHRDLHPRQIFDDGSRVTFVDLDSIGLSHPALDLANVAVVLAVRHPDVAPPLLAAFRTGYAAAGGDGAGPEAVYRAFTFLRLAVKTCRVQPVRWPELAEALLAQAAGELAAAGGER